MSLRSKGLTSKTFIHTGEALEWAKKTFTGDRENEEELARVRLMLTNIEFYGRANQIKMIFTSDGSVHHLESYDSTGNKVGEY